MRIFNLRNIVLSCFLCSTTAYAQNCLDEIYQSKLYSNSDGIINGRKWIYEKRYLGSPFLVDRYWPRSDILYDGAVYTGIIMNYDLSKDELIIYFPEAGNEKYLVISNDNLSGFSFIDTIRNQKYFYEYTKLPGTIGKTLYEKLHFRSFSFYIRPMKFLETRSAGSGPGEYTELSEYYLDTGNGFIEFRSKSELVKILPEHKSEINKYLRTNSLQISSRKPSDIIAVLRFIDELK